MKKIIHLSKPLRLLRESVEDLVAYAREKNGFGPPPTAVKMAFAVHSEDRKKYLNLAARFKPEIAEVLPEVWDGVLITAAAVAEKAISLDEGKITVTAAVLILWQGITAPVSPYTDVPTGVMADWGIPLEVGSDRPLAMAADAEL